MFFDNNLLIKQTLWLNEINKFNEKLLEMSELLSYKFNFTIN